MSLMKSLRPPQVAPPKSISDDPSVDVTIRPVLEPTHDEAVMIEAKKGYDLLFIGLEKTKTPSGAFHSRIDQIAAAFEGPMATVMAQGKQLEEPTSKARCARPDYRNGRFSARRRNRFFAWQRHHRYGALCAAKGSGEGRQWKFEPTSGKNNFERYCRNGFSLQRQNRNAQGVRSSTGKRHFK